MRLSSLLLLLGVVPAQAATIVGTDYQGANLTPANGDTLSGIFTNVGSVTIPTGVTVFVAPNVDLIIYASTVGIYGTLDGYGRGYPGGAGGSPNADGNVGFSPATGGGNGGQADINPESSNAGGGGAGGGDGGAGSGAFFPNPPAAGGTAYGATGAQTIPISQDDAVQGSGGGGGGGGVLHSSGGGTTGPGGSGAAGGAAIYIEASSITIAGTISVRGSTATATVHTGNRPHPGGGGGGGGGTIVLRARDNLEIFSGSNISAEGGSGGNIASTAFGGPLSPGGGGGGGRLKFFARQATYGAVTLSTASGGTGVVVGGIGVLDSTPPVAGQAGTMIFGTVAAPPSNFAATTVFIASISYSWSASAAFGDGPSTTTYRLFSSTSLPLATEDARVSATAFSVPNLTPNTTYFRVVTAFTDWGDSEFSNSVTTHTLANAPGEEALPFSNMAATSLQLTWNANAPANPSYTRYEINRSSVAGFGVSVSTSFVVATSSAPAGLAPNTTYFLRVRAINLNDVPSDFTSTFSTATLAETPSAPGFGNVYIDSVAFVWSRGANPADTMFEAQISTDNFFTLAGASSTLGNSTTFFSLTPGTQYYLRVYATNRNSVATSFTTVISTRSGNLADESPPTTPGTPVANTQFSYDGTAAFDWASAQSAVGILHYQVLVGNTLGGSELFNSTVAANHFDVAGMISGLTYYARVRARSNAGVWSEFSNVSVGLPVFIASQTQAIAKPTNWPNPFSPANGPTQIGFFLDGPAEVVIKIYTLQGQLVSEQTRHYGGSGNQIAEWSGANGAGVRVAPGGYIAVIQKRYGGRVDTQKLKIAVLY